MNDIENSGKDRDPFRFYARLNLSELTGLRATTLKQLVMITKDALDSCIYNHTHRFLQQHQYLSPEPPNDFAYWVTNILGEKDLGERLMSINTIQFGSIDSLRRKIVATISQYLKEEPLARLRFTSNENSFYFIKSVSFIFPTNYMAHDLKEFAQVLKKITIDSIYFHIFESRLRLGRNANDFSNWIRESIGNEELADEISKLDPYAYTLEELRTILIQLIEKNWIRAKDGESKRI
jgi:hypothetical protein